MPARNSFFVGAIVAAGIFTAPGALADTNPSALVYTPWTKFCFADMCFTGSGARSTSGCGPRFAAVIVGRDVEPKKILRVTVPNSAGKANGVRVGIDRDPPIERPFKGCYSMGCVADIEDGPELIDRLKRGQMLVITVTDASGAPVSIRLPLANFATAYDGPPPPPKMFENQPGKLQEELKARQQHGPRPDADRKSPCGEN